MDLKKINQRRKWLRRIIFFLFLHIQYKFNLYKSLCWKSSNKNTEILNNFCSLPICMSPNSPLQKDQKTTHHLSSLVICVMRENLAYVAEPCQQLYSRGEGHSYPHNMRLSPHQPTRAEISNLFPSFILVCRWANNREDDNKEYNGFDDLHTYLHLKSLRWKSSNKSAKNPCKFTASPCVHKFPTSERSKHHNPSSSFVCGWCDVAQW